MTARARKIVHSAGVRPTYADYRRVTRLMMRGEPVAKSDRRTVDYVLDREIRRGLRLGFLVTAAVFAAALLALNLALTFSGHGRSLIGWIFPVGVTVTLILGIRRQMMLRRWERRYR